MDILIEFISIVWESFWDVVSTYEVWCFLGGLAIAAGIILYKLFERVAMSSGRGAGRQLRAIREIANLPEEEIEILRVKNEPKLIIELVDEAVATLKILEHLSKRPRGKAETRQHRMLKRRANINLRVLPERYRALKKGGLFSQYQDRGNRLR